MNDDGTTTPARTGRNIIFTSGHDELDTQLQDEDNNQKFKVIARAEDRKNIAMTLRNLEADLAENNRDLTPPPSNSFLPDFDQARKSSDGAVLNLMGISKVVDVSHMD